MERRERIMLRLDDREWRIFHFKQIFDIRNGFYNKKPPCIAEGVIPFIGASDSNNGFTGFTTHDLIEANSKVGYGTNETIDKKLFEGNAICVTNNGSVGYAYYQKHRFTCTHDVNPLYLRGRELNCYLAMFLICCIEQQRVCFAYSRKWRPARMVKSKLILPVTASGEPDWAFMEEYMRWQESQVAVEQLSCQQMNVEDANVECQLQTVCWEPFYLTDIFTEIQRGKRLKKADHVAGSTPYVSSTAFCNGIDGFIGNAKGVRVFENCLTLANSGSVGSTFFHPYAFVASDHVTQLRRPGLDKYAYLFLATLVGRIAGKYSFNREINDERIQRERILLPVNAHGEIDFAFMSSFMRQLEMRVYSGTRPMLRGGVLFA